MKEFKTKLFAGKDNDVIIKIKKGFVVSDINEFQVTLTKDGVNHIFKKSTGEITISGLDIKISIAKTAITSAGVYAVKMEMIDIAGKDRGITANPETLTFY